MDDTVQRSIDSIKNWKELAQFEANARERGRLDDEVKLAVRLHSFKLGRQLIAERTGLDLSDLSPVEVKIVEAVSQYVAIKKTTNGTDATYTFRQIENNGLIGAAESAVARSAPTQGFQTLADAQRGDISYEQVVVDHPEEFSARALWFARRALGLPNDIESPPSKGQDVTQMRTHALISWLKKVAHAKGGVLPAFTNADAATAMGMEDLQRFGRVHGNTQSRIDFACFRAGLPPLGLTAEAPFEAAWATEGRDWSYPIREMQEAAQRRVWTDADFDLILRESERLPGLAHKLWKDALAKREPDVKAWAFGLVSGSGSGSDAAVSEPETRQPRNAIWSRDELILALDLYLRNRAAPLGNADPAITELSELLNELGEALGRRETPTYRNPNGVYMKLMNFRRFDPEFAAEGKTGLTRGNADEERVWDQFASDPDELARVAHLIREGLAAHGGRGDLSGPDEPGIEEAEEGRVLTRLHRVKERDRRLVEAAKNAALREHGRLFCVACSFDFGRRYGAVGEGIIDVHHTRPVHTLEPGEKTKVSELVLLCANCHRLVHSKRKWLSIAEVRDALAAASPVFGAF